MQGDILYLCTCTLFLSFQFSVVPVCMYSNVKYIYVNLGDTVSVPCPMKAFPHDATVTWVRRSTNQTLHRETAVRWSASDVAESELQYTARYTFNQYYNVFRLSDRGCMYISGCAWVCVCVCV